MSDSKSSGGIGTGSLLTIAFVVLKLCHVIDWSWWWVLSPVWIGIAIALVILAVYLIVVASAKEKPREKSRWQSRLEEIQKEQREKRAKNNL